jgi:hypothetical protein
MKPQSCPETPNTPGGFSARGGVAAVSARGSDERRAPATSRSMRFESRILLLGVKGSRVQVF